MPYITIPQTTARQISFDDILDGTVSIPTITNQITTDTRTYYKGSLKESYLKPYDFDSMIETLVKFNAQHEDLFNAKRESLYNTFYIPKKK